MNDIFIVKKRYEIYVYRTMHYFINMNQQVNDLKNTWKRFKKIQEINNFSISSIIYIMLRNIRVDYREPFKFTTIIMQIVKSYFEEKFFI